MFFHYAHKFCQVLPKAEKAPNKLMLKREREREKERKKERKKHMQRAKKMQKDAQSFSRSACKLNLSLFIACTWIKCNNLPLYDHDFGICLDLMNDNFVVELGILVPKNWPKWCPRVSPYYDLRLEKSACMGQLCSLQQRFARLLLPLVPSLLWVFFKTTLKFT